MPQVPDVASFTLARDWVLCPTRGLRGPRSKGVTLDDENRGRYLIGSEIGVFFLVTLRAGEVAALPA
ncbi:MAG: hypothetical protein JNM69_35125 [Archangium sp.]|nr:hypothetical protein [Archangium sp.]